MKSGSPRICECWITHLMASTEDNGNDEFGVLIKMAAMSSKFIYECVIQYYIDQATTNFNPCK